VVIRGIETAKVVDLEPLTNFMSKKIEGVHIILVGEGFPQSQNFKKAVEKLGTVLTFEPLKGAELRRWTERELKQAGVVGATDEMVELALSLAAEEPEAIAALIEKLSLYLDGDAPTTEVMRTLIPGRSSASDFELADALMSKKRAPTEILIHQLISQGSSPFMLLGLLTKTFVTLYRIRAMLDKGLQQQDIRTALGISPWLFNRYFPIARTQTLRALSSHCEALLRADFRLKDKSIGHGATFSTLASQISQRA
jgi:DNA polymerase-3 subunit delta